MKPGCGNGTFMMTFWRNQSRSCCSASLLTAVGLTRVSIGPPISVIVAGRRRSPRASISATAASTGTDGWHTAMMWASGPRQCRIEMR